MTKTVHFTKMHGAGNDYIYVDTRLYDIPNPSEAAIAWSKPHTGIGSDGLVLIGHSPTPEADFSMRIFNADGSEALMCGNASRCIGKYLYEKRLTGNSLIRLHTQSGIKLLQLSIENDEVRAVTVDMLRPSFSNAALFSAPTEADGTTLLMAGGKQYRGTFVSMGNPHFVVFVDSLPQVDVAAEGSLLERHEAFPCRCNIEFAEVLADGTIRTRVWERGSGITQACGTGACATAVAAALTGRTGRRSHISMDGGELDIEWRETDDHVMLRGPASFVFEGDVALP